MFVANSTPPPKKTKAAIKKPPTKRKRLNKNTSGSDSDFSNSETNVQNNSETDSPVKRPGRGKKQAKYVFDDESDSSD